MWVLLMYLHLNGAPTIATQEFESQQTCQAAGARMYEFSGHELKWSCLKK